MKLKEKINTKNKTLYIILSIAIAILILLGSFYFITEAIKKDNIKQDLENEKLYNQYIKEWSSASTAVLEYHISSSLSYTEEKGKLVNNVAQKFGFEKEINSKESSEEFIFNYLSQNNQQPKGETDKIVFDRITIILKEYFKTIPTAKTSGKTFWYSPDFATVIYADASFNAKSINELLPENIRKTLENHTNLWISLPDGKVAPKEQNINITCVGNGSYEIVGDKFKGNRITVKSIANEGYELEGFYDSENSLITMEENYAFTVTDNCDLTIKFKTKICTISAEYGGGTVKGTGTFNVGDKVKLEAIPSEGYLFEGFYLDNELVSDNQIFEFEAKDTQTYFAKFTKISD